MAHRIIFTNTPKINTSLTQKFVVGSGVGSRNRSVYRALQNRASNDAHGKPCCIPATNIEAFPATNIEASTIIDIADIANKNPDGTYTLKAPTIIPAGYELDIGNFTLNLGGFTLINDGIMIIGGVNGQAALLNINGNFTNNGTLTVKQDPGVITVIPRNTFTNNGTITNENVITIYGSFVNNQSGIINNNNNINAAININNAGLLQNDGIINNIVGTISNNSYTGSQFINNNIINNYANFLNNSNLRFKEINFLHGQNARFIGIRGLPVIICHFYHCTFFFLIAAFPPEVKTITESFSSPLIVKVYQARRLVASAKFYIHF
jgi:hypothetical protein